MDQIAAALAEKDAAEVALLEAEALPVNMASAAIIAAAAQRLARARDAVIATAHPEFAPGPTAAEIRAAEARWLGKPRRRL